MNTMMRQETLRLIEAEGRRGLLIAGDVGNSDFCREARGRRSRCSAAIDILVNNAG